MAISKNSFAYIFYTEVSTLTYPALFSYPKKCVNNLHVEQVSHYAVFSAGF